MGKQRKSVTVKLVSEGKGSEGKSTGFYRTVSCGSQKLDSLKGRKIFDPRAIHPTTGRRGAHVTSKLVKKLK